MMGKLCGRGDRVFWRVCRSARGYHGNALEDRVFAGAGSEQDWKVYVHIDVWRERLLAGRDLSQKQLEW